MYCIGCGEPLRVTSGPCSACRIDVSGANLRESVVVEYGKSVIAPPLCCCCLAPRQDTRQEEIATIPLRFFPNMRLADHVPRCDAVHGSAGKRNAELVFGNRTFARIWRDVNAGRASAAPALAWVEKTEVAEEELVPRAMPRNTLVDTDARVRQQLETGKVPPRSRLKLQTPAVSADATSEILRFAVKSLDITADRLVARGRNGATREVFYSAVSRLTARRTRDEPPFRGTVFLDVVPADSEPLRLLPTTRANYGVLPGTGATSHENFRRLVLHLKARAPHSVIEAESSPYLEYGIGLPPRLETTEALVAFDRRYP